ncbi:hypothetical protein [Actinoplanes sp. N902-109]|uniref:hypothetical protein n=1 Tax=Actinoplanes sp. (strain N902-109) TaxID=649831 RepID=UPI000329600C|nr:hypothetical protein [Actinoplanes sp. N902-109]AGL18441.1 hypothetical protein L083_4931 [Actinoplanes sp. N902-109]
MQIPDAGALLSTEVLSADGAGLGRVGIVFRPDGAVQPLLVAFPAEADTPHVAPLLGAELGRDGLVLAYSAAQLRAAPTIDAGAELSVGEIGAVLAYYGIPLRSDLPLTTRVSGTGDVGSTVADVRLIPAIPGIGDDDLPPIVVSRPGWTPRG